MTKETNAKGKASKGVGKPKEEIEPSKEVTITWKLTDLPTAQHKGRFWRDCSLRFGQ